MNDLLIELCERKNYKRTMKVLEKKFGKRVLLGRLENFTKYMTQAKNVKPKIKLSFDVSIQFR